MEKNVYGLNNLNTCVTCSQYQFPLSAGGTTFSLKFWKGGDQEKNEYLGRLKESLPQMFALGGLLYMFPVKKDLSYKMKYGF